MSCSYTLKGHKIVSNPWKFPSTLPAKVGGEGILFPWFGVLVVSISVHISDHFHRGVMGQCAPCLASNVRDLYRSTRPISGILLLVQSKGKNEAIMKPIHQGIS